MRRVHARRERRIQELFDAAVDLPPEDRAAFLHRACGEDASLHAAVDRLLDSDATEDEFLDSPLIEPVVGLEADVPRQHCEGTLGRYELLGKIGEGGSSTVYLARPRDRELHRRVAIKILRRSELGSHRARRIMDEAKVLAQLEHPFIARLIDADRTPDGRPFLVMEYVHGRSLTEHCDERRLSIDERLELFCAVCEAVQHAHGALFVHRDLKPGNILVTPDGSPKLLDFGLARLLEPESDGEATATAVRVLTLHYASPEQLAGARETSCSDTYSLGVVLYELLTGGRPYDWEGMSLFEILAQLRHSRPVPPSLSLGDDASAATTAELRSTTRQGLARKLRGDLDNIVLRALRFEAERRYSSPKELADDLSRFRSGRPVSARPATALYRVGKFVRRNAVVVSLAATLSAVLAGSALVATLQASRLARERNTAQEAQARADAVTRVLVESFTVSNPYRGYGPELTARQVLDAGAARIERELDATPQLQAALKHTIGEIYSLLSVNDRARALLESALDQRRAAGVSEADVAATLAAIATVQMNEGELGEAEASVLEALDLQRGAAPESNGMANLLRLHGEILSLLSRHDEAVRLVSAALAMHRELLGEDHADVANDLNSLAMLHYRRGDYAGAEEAARQCLQIVRPRAASSPASLSNVVNNLAIILFARGRFAEAEPLYEEALELRRGAYDEDHPAVANSLNSLGLLRLEVGDTAAAERLLRRALAIDRAAFGDFHPDIVTVLMNLGEVLDVAGRLEEAAAANAEAAHLAADWLPESHPVTAFTLYNTGLVALHRGRLDEARRNLERAMSLRREALPATHPDVQLVLLALARLDQVEGRLEAAETKVRSFLAQVEVTWPSGQWQPAWGRVLLADLLLATGRPGEALPLARAAEQRLASVYPPGHFRRATAASVLGLALVSNGLLGEGLTLLRDAHGDLLGSRGAAALHARQAAGRLERAAASAQVSPSMRDAVR